MVKDALKIRQNWQTNGESRAVTTRNDIYRIFRDHFKGTEYVFHVKPQHLKNIYGEFELPQNVLDQIYNPDICFEDVRWGVTPGFAVENKKTKKMIFVEIKRQDGWTKSTNQYAGRGNAHERLCKLFTPGLMKAYRKAGHMEDADILPFWVIFEGDITLDPKRNREIAFWFDGYDKNFFMWRPAMTEQELIDHFEQYLKPYLE